ncbi:MAG: hypothetical protein D8M58_19875 [Calditrichaeota bacterium]|nr:MAG: hypothetical protein DWQ03_14620 [Calditrichota bacterium]MBL1207669.1 hypothetical protein [Calditrichota bacterium]NOG47502.1 hypothetical protein [Calditrichota bacterium]
MKKQPLAEVFGFPINNLSKEAERYRKNKLCPFHNRVPSCTKNSATKPLGVCSIFYEKNTIVTCPIRFTEEWLITEQAAKFIFNKNIVEKGMWTTLREIKLVDANDKTAGNIDYVLVSYDENGNLTDFGSLEVQAVYISGNITNPFNYYMEDRTNRTVFDWSKNKFFPRPDFLSSSRKRLVPQLVYKGGIFKSWNKKQCVVLQKGFFETLPKLPIVKNPENADFAWFIYDLKSNKNSDKLKLVLDDIVYTEFHPALNKILTPNAGKIESFVQELQSKLDNQLDINSPDAPTLIDIISE